MKFDDRLFVAGQIAFAAALAWAVIRTPARSTGGVALAVAGAGTALGAAALWRLRHSFRVRPLPLATGRLERGGPYRRLRHPMYVSVQLWGLAAVIWRPAPLTAGLAIAQYAFYWAKSRYEEARLRQRYPEYPDYQRRSRGLWP